MAEPFLSSSWYRVAQLSPRLRSHVHVSRHHYRGRPWYVLQDQASAQTHRLTPAAYQIIGLMDGRWTLDEIWTDAVERLGEEAPSQDEVIRLLGQLHAADVLQCDLSPDVAEAFKRFSKRESTRLWKGLLTPLSLRVPLWDPDRFLERTSFLIAPFFGPLGAVLWLVVVGPAIILAAVHWSELTENWSDRILVANNVVLISLVYVVVKGLHELGHAYATKLNGGEVHDLGVMFLVFYPVPYVDASAASSFRFRSHRMLVGAAGMLVEVFLAALALYTWLIVEPGLIRAAAFNVMLIAGVSTVLFNANPLLRFDGYYILSDLLEIPNLAARANRYWVYLIERHVFRTEGVRDFMAGPGERGWFIAFAPLSFVYRMSIMLGIALFLASQFLVVGIALALWNIASGVLIPAAKALWAVVSSPRYSRNRGRVVGITFGVTLTLSAALLAVPLPLHTLAEGVVWLPETALVRAGTDGFVRRVRAVPGQWVEPGLVLIESEEVGLAAKVNALSWQFRELDARFSSEQFSDRVAAEVTRREREYVQATLQREQLREKQLAAVSQAIGIFSLASPDDLPGRFIREGEVLAYVLPARPCIARVTVSQENIGLVREGARSVQLKIAGRLDETFDVKLVREVPAGADELPSRALGMNGGGTLATDPRDQDGRRALQRVFQFDVALPNELSTVGFGNRVYVRIEHDPEPLGWQIYRRARQLLLSRLHA